MPEPPTAPLPGRLSPGLVLRGNLEIERFVGAGGMGEVYAAYHRHFRKRVAVKVLSAARSRPEHQRRFLREGRLVDAIVHPNVVRIFEIFEDERLGPVLVMELLTGESLRERMNRERRLSLSAAADVLVPVAGALDAAHHAGIVHRDIKPENIFLAEAPGGARVPKILDFGIAKLMQGELHDNPTGEITDAPLGTLWYMSYEQAMAEQPVDARTDIWSIGVVLYEMLAGQRPIQGKNPLQFVHALLQAEIVPLRTYVPDLPLEVASVVDRCLQRSPEARLDTLSELIEALSPHVTAPATGVPASAGSGDALSEDGVPAAMPAELPAAMPAELPAAMPAARRPARRWALAVAAAAGVGITGWLGVSALRPPSRGSVPEASAVRAQGSVAAVPSTSTTAPLGDASIVPAPDPPPAASQVTPVSITTAITTGPHAVSSARVTRTAPAPAALHAASSAAPSRSAAPRVGIPERMPY